MPDSPERLALASRLTHSHRAIFLMAWAGWIFDFYEILLLIFLVQGPMGKEFAWGPRQVGWVVGLQLASTGLGGALFGYLGDRFGRKRALAWTILVYSSGTLMRGLTGWAGPPYGYLLFWTLFAGLGIGGEWGLGQNLIGETFPPSVRGRWGGYMQAGAPIGVLLAAFMGVYGSSWIGWRGTFFVSALPALLVVGIRRRMPESDLWQQERLRDLRAPRALAGLFERDMRATFLKAFVLVLFAMSSYWFVYSFLVTYVQKELGLTSPADVMTVFGFLQSGGLLGYLAFGAISDRLGRRPTFTAYCLLQASGVLGLTLVFEQYRQRGTPLYLAFFAAGLGTGIWSLFGPYFSELFPTTIRATATGAAYNVARGIMLATPLLIATLEARDRFAAGVALGALFSVLAAAWIWTLPETKGKRLA